MTNRSEDEPSGRASGGRSYEGIKKDEKRGTWIARYRFAPGSNGMRTKRGFETQAAAKRWRDEKLGHKAEGSAADPRKSRVVVGIYAERWLELRRRDENVAMATYKAEWSRWNTGLKATFGDMPLEDVTRGVVRDWQVEAATGDRKRGPKTVSLIQGTLKMILDYAVDCGALRVNPIAGMPRPQSPRVDTRPILPDDIRDYLLDNTGDRERIGVELAYLAGLRRGEFLGLALSDVTLNENGDCELRIDWQMDKYNRRRPPKHDHRRTVVVDSAVYDLVQAHVSRYDVSTDHGLVMSYKDGTAMTHRRWRFVFDPIARAAGMPVGMGIHELRASYISEALASGDEKRAVADNVGHRSTATLDPYERRVTRKAVGSSAAAARTARARRHLKAV